MSSVEGGVVASKGKKKVGFFGWIKRILIALLVVFVGLFVIGLMVGKDKAHDASVSPPISSNSESQAPAKAAEPVIEVSTDQLARDYGANEVSADDKYKGKLLKVGGIVQEIGKDFADDPFVSLRTDNEFMPVRASFAKSALQRLASMHKGQSITLTCRGKGMVIGSPILDCTDD